jgi:hypothetical protein
MKLIRFHDTVCHVCVYINPNKICAISRLQNQTRIHFSASSIDVNEDSLSVAMTLRKHGVYVDDLDLE